MTLPLPCPPEHWATFSSLLDEACALPPAGRPAWLASLPPPHAALRAYLEPVLARWGDVAGQPALDGPRLPPGLPQWRPGDRVGPYGLVAPLGEGGMGAVWRARRMDGAYEREVALKLPHPHLLAGAVTQRFARERDILAGLVHPHIAAFLDAGLSAEGQPYLAMELVEGRPITDAARSLGLAQRLALFMQVLQAVGHAHSRLVAHRDIKPANVLVDAAARVKLLDFGIAKLLQGDPLAGDLTNVLAPATPRYAAPEQRQGGPVTAATDIYALGLLLHELLAGTPAWPNGVPAIGGEPPLPSRCTVDPTLRKALRGNLDAIVHRALQAWPEARYPSAEAFQADLQRHLEHRPVAARRITPWVRLCMFVRRHRLPVALGAALAASLAAGVAGMAWQTAQAQAQARRAEAVKQFLVSVFEGADPRLAGNRPRGMTPVRELLDRHVEAIDQRFAGDPLLRIELLRLAAELYRELDEPQAHGRWQAAFDEAAAQHLSPLHTWRLGARVQALEAAFRRGDLARCRAELPGLDADLRRAGLDHGELRAAWWLNRALCHMDQPGSEALRLQSLQQAQALYTQVAPGGRGEVTAWAEIGSLHVPAGRYDDALAAMRRAVSLTQAQPLHNRVELVTLHGNIGLALQQSGRLDEAASAYARAADAADASVGASHPVAWVPRASQLATLHLAGRRTEAWTLLPSLQAALAGRADAPVDAARVREEIGSRLAAEGRAAEAVPWLRQALAGYRQGSTHEFYVRKAQRNLGDALDRAGRHAEGGALLEQALRAYEAAGDPAHQAVAAARERWARWLLDQGCTAEAQGQFDLTVAQAGDKRWAHVALAQAGLARAALASGQGAAAGRHSADALATWDALVGFRDVRMQAYLWRVRASVLEQDDATRADAERLWQRALEASARADAPDAPTLRRPRRLGTTDGAPVQGCRAGRGGPAPR